MTTDRLRLVTILAYARIGCGFGARELREPDAEGWVDVLALDGRSPGEEGHHGLTIEARQVVQ